MKPITEEFMKSILDGTYTYMDSNGNYVTKEVENDYINKDFKKPKNYKTSTPWSKMEDEALVEMMAKEQKFHDVSWVLNRTEEAVKQRYRMLRLKRGVLKCQIPSSL